MTNRPSTRRQADSRRRPRPGLARATKSRRGRPTASQVAAINRAILEAATERFLADGYGVTSMEAVAAAAAVSKGTLYARYPTKEDLLRAVVENRVDAWSASSAANDHLMSDQFEPRLRYHAETIVRFLGTTEVQAFERLLGGALGKFPELGQVFCEHAYEVSLDMLTREIADGTRHDVVPARNPRQVAEILLGALGGWYRKEQMLRPVSRKKARQFANAVVDVLIAGRAAW